MTTILCRSAKLAEQLASFSGPGQSVIYTAVEGDSGLDCAHWLSNFLRTHDVSLVLYEARFFVDPAPFRSVSPKTRFVILGSPGEEETVRVALAQGASAVIEKPIVEQDVLGVLALVSH